MNDELNQIADEQLVDVLKGDEKPLAPEDLILRVSDVQTILSLDNEE